ncbi:unnamed protein product [Mycetohabitans rhizoxinica HKI 454]|jgi:hypothetical protein|uniref:Uncharacterized protein n=1 Tax=Mycetohabitans rhizoxinica (strain DSM 19002 / CIP 109453 / HKI 454) TaxID=882378 RepID=E5APP8_MYCRK|nr:unnamed protein product [Mycetohabitans rhizoxinica HKI 454]
MSSAEAPPHLMLASVLEPVAAHGNRLAALSLSTKSTVRPKGRELARIGQTRVNQR